jgi:hypothetical protein
MFQARVPADRRPAVSGTLVVETCAGGLLTRSDAWVYILWRLGGLWGICAALLAGVPRPIRDACYDFVARSRYRAFGRQADSCPMRPPHLAAPSIPDRDHCPCGKFPAHMHRISVRQQLEKGEYGRQSMRRAPPPRIITGPSIGLKFGFGTKSSSSCQPSEYCLKIM